MKSKRLNIYEVLIVFILFFSPFTSLGIAGVKISEVLVLILFFIALLRKDIKIYKKSVFAKFMLVYIFLCCIGFGYKYIFVKNSYNNFNEIFFDLLAYIFILITSLVIESLILRKERKISIYTILKKLYYFSSFILLILFVLSRFTSSLFGFRLIYYQYFCPFAKNIHHVAMYVAVFPFIGYMLFCNEKGTLRKIFIIFLIFSNIIIGYNTGASKIVLGWIVGMVVTIYVNLRNINIFNIKFKKIAKTCFYTILLSITVIFLKDIVSYFISLFVKNDLNGGRTNIYTLGLQIAMKSAFTGLGPGKHIYYLGIYYDPHQTFLLSFLQAGIIGLAIYINLILKIIKYVIKNKYVIGAVTSIIIYALGGDIMRRLPCWVFLILFYYLELDKNKVHKLI